jgi:hypothetical protein
MITLTPEHQRRNCGFGGSYERKMYGAELRISFEEAEKMLGAVLMLPKCTRYFSGGSNEP